jgi:hypothetical protein
VLGGLAVSTIFTLFLVPTLFSLMMEFKEGVLRWFGRQPSQDESTPQPVPREPRVEQPQIR